MGYGVIIASTTQEQGVCERPVVIDIERVPLLMEYVYIYSCFAIYT